MPRSEVMQGTTADSSAAESGEHADSNAVEAETSCAEELGENVNLASVSEGTGPYAVMESGWD